MSETNKPLIGRMLQIVSGLTDLSSRDVQKYRDLMEQQGYILPELKVKSPPVRHHKTRQSRASSLTSSERVGTALKARIEGLLSIKATHATCNCQTLATEMDRWGITGCESRRDHIVGQLMEKADMLGVSLSKATVAYVKGVGIIAAAGTASALVGDWWSGKDVEHEAKLAGANWLLTQAIEDVRSQLKQSQSQLRQSRIVNRGGNRGGNPAFTMGSDKPRFITLEQYSQDIRILLSKIPNDVDAVAGVARSGLYPASMVAMWLHKPMIIVSQTRGDIVDAGNGWRLTRGHNHVEPGRGRVLVIDDTVMSGGSQHILRKVVGKQFSEVIFATVYCNPAANMGKPDIHAVDLQWPHLLEWNLFNSVMSNSTAVDFDGILCHDCKSGQDDDGPAYLDFIRTATPLYLPRQVPIPLIVTARIEKYRAETEAWMHRQGIRWTKLVMHPAGSTREREQDDIAAYKAKHYMAWASKHRPAPGPIMFIESDDRQAQRIAQISGRMVICPHTAGVY